MKLQLLKTLFYIFNFQMMFMAVKLEIMNFPEKLVDIFADKFQIPGAKPIQEIINEAYMEPTELIQFYGYSAENHSVITQDNYTLIMHRIPYGKNGPLSTSGIPVILLHSLTCTSTQYIDNGEKSLGFVLADEGYDVWSANFRGSVYTYHSTYSRKKKQYWNFNADSLALNDLPTIIDGVLDKTGHSKVFLIGHSLGTAIGLLTLAGKPKYNDKVAAFIAMAPIILPKYTTLLPQPLLSQMETIMEALQLMGQHSLFASKPGIQKLTLKACPSSNPLLCLGPTYPIFGYNPYLRNKTRVPINSYHCSKSGGAIKLFQHAAQIHNSQIIRMFDFGLKKNLYKYNKPTPPEYNLSQITTPTVFFYAPNDAVATPIDVTILAKKIPNLVGKELFPHPFASHADFTWAANAERFVYDKIIIYLRQLWK